MLLTKALSFQICAVTFVVQKTPPSLSKGKIGNLLPLLESNIFKLQIVKGATFYKKKAPANP